jgi:hypothetical protein
MLRVNGVTLSWVIPEEVGLKVGHNLLPTAEVSHPNRRVLN